MAVNIGLGCVTFGREINRRDSFVLMDHAHDMGITSFDTAAAYGDGLSETIIGEWIKAKGLKNGAISIATKILPPYHPSQIITSVEASINRLGVNVIDILYLHRWDESINDDTWRLLDNLKREGKINAIGVSNFNLEQLTELVQASNNKISFKPDYIQNNHNIAVRDITGETKLLCAKNNIRIITYSPLGAGFLTGKHISGVVKNSRFDIKPAHQDIYFNDEARNRLSKLMQIASQIDQPPELLAMAWALHQSKIYSVLVGGRNIQQLDLVTKAMKFSDPEIFAQLETI